MPLPQYLKYNPKASYRLGTVFDYTKDERAQVAALLKSQDIYISDQNFFKTDWFDLSQKYIMPHITTQAVIDAWSSNPMQFWQNQLQFALWCATAGCGVSVKDHLLNENLRPLARSFFRFHVYYQTRRILAEMKCPLPTRDSWNAFNNGIDHHAYQRICGEFQVDYKHTEAWHLTEKQCPSNGMGHTFMRVNFYINVNNAFDIPGVPVLVNHHDAYCGEIIIPHWGAYDKFVHKFDTPLDYDGLYWDSQQHRMILGGAFGRLEYISKDAVNSAFAKLWEPFYSHTNVKFLPMDLENGYVWSMLEKSDGFTRGGVERINDSIRAYAWAILGAQGQSRASVLGAGTAFGTQKQFADNVEAKIYSADDLSKSITQYQEVLQYARSKLDYVIGGELYMLPSDMDLRIGTIEGYNNEIMVATDDMSPFTNDRINDVKSPPQAPVVNGITNPPPTKNETLRFTPHGTKKDVIELR